MKNLKVKQFNIQEWLDNPNILVCTRYGNPARIRSYHPEILKPVTFGIRLDKDDAYEYEQCYEDGRCSKIGTTVNDLFIYNDEYFTPFQEDLKETIVFFEKQK